ncbi:hypothetical protein VNO78_24899 [Psophocarpus tetragonolobus]|uniref:Germin-like protein n=1 Tax=Psophocarpus tetragonolobus TaxID=3891 RepID=A0AAN9S524_PSOTE
MVPGYSFENRDEEHVSHNSCFSTCYASNVNDICVAEQKDTVTANELKYNLQSVNVTIPIGVTASGASVDEFPALNGLKISVGRLEMDRGGFFPMHTHPGGHEILIVVQGEITVGIVTPTKAYVNALKPGELMALPQALMHFLVNSGKGKAVAYAIYGSARPRFSST